MPDYYLNNPEALEGKPKRTISRYSAEKGFPTAKELSLEDAIISDVNIIARSEMTQDYDGASGLIDSIVIPANSKLRKDGLTEQRLKEIALESSGYLWKHYCRVEGISEEEFLKGLSFSCFELLDGFNRSIIGDSAIKGRYHIITKQGHNDISTYPLTRKEGYAPSHHADFRNYLIIEDGKIILEMGASLPDDLRAHLPNTIEMYNNFRTQNRFDPVHMPIIEAQTVQTKNGLEDMFLQYKRNRDFEEVDFTLPRDSASEFKALYLRGSTGKEGIFAEIHVSAKLSGQSSVHSRNLLYEKEINMLLGRIPAYSGEIDPSWLIPFISDGMINHLGISNLFRPQVSVIADSKIISRIDQEIAKEYALEGYDYYVPIHIVSDGRNTIIERR